MARPSRFRSLPAENRLHQRRCPEYSLKDFFNNLGNVRIAAFKEIKDRLTRFSASTGRFLPQLVTRCLPNIVDQHSWDDL